MTGSPSRGRGRPRKRTSPACGHTSPLSIRKSVNFPAPLGPISAVVLPGATARSTGPSAIALSYRFTTPAASKTGVTRPQPTVRRACRRAHLRHLAARAGRAQLRCRGLHGVLEYRVAVFRSWYATCPRGAEEALEGELQAIGAKGVRPAHGGVRFT